MKITPEEKAAIKELKNLPYLKIKAENLQAKIFALDEISNGGVSYDGIKVDSGFRNSVETNLIAHINDKEKLEQELKTTKANIEIIERALDSLTADERTVLTMMYIDRQYYSYDKLAAELNVGVSKVYEIRTSAIRAFMKMISV